MNNLPERQRRWRRGGDLGGGGACVCFRVSPTTPFIAVVVHVRMRENYRYLSQTIDWQHCVGAALAVCCSDTRPRDQCCLDTDAAREQGGERANAHAETRVRTASVKLCMQISLFQMRTKQLTAVGWIDTLRGPRRAF